MRFELKRSESGWNVIDTDQTETHYLSNGILSSGTDERGRENAQRIADTLNTAADTGAWSPRALERLELVTAETREQLAERDSYYRRPECPGHPAGEFDRMGETVYCDGSCTG